MSNIDDEDSLYRLACECENFFDKLQGDRGTIKAEICAEFQQRFAIWAANLGVFARKSQCLDTRLRNIPELQDLVARLLDILRRNLQRCIAEAEIQDRENIMPADLEAQYEINGVQAVAQIIDDTLTRLSRLGVTIRRSSHGKLDTRLQKFAADVNLEPFEYLCTFSVQMLYPEAHQSLKEYLGKSMAQRYAKMLFITSRREKLRTRRDPLPSIPETTSFKMEARTEPMHPLRIIDNLTVPKITTAYTPASQSDLSTVNIQEIRNRRQQPDEASTRRHKTSSIQINQANYPRLPGVDDNISIRTCPWCTEILSRTVSENEWRRHVDHDLEPYICLAEECPDIHRAYPTFDGWLKHMRSHNRRWHERFYLTPSWICTVCEVNAELYDNPHALYSHMERFHDDDFTNDQLEIISRQSKLDQPRAGNECLLCCFVVEEQEIRGGEVFHKRRKGDVKQESFKAARKAPEMTNPDPHSSSLSGTSSDSDNSDNTRDKSRRNEDHSTAVARHIAAHLQTLLFLTLRFADIQNCSPGLDDDINSNSFEIDDSSGSSKHSGVARLSDIASESDTITREDAKNLVRTEKIIGEDSPEEDDILIPDTDLDLSDIPRQHDGLKPENDDFLKGLIESGAYQPSRINTKRVRSHLLSIFSSYTVNRTQNTKSGTMDDIGLTGRDLYVSTSRRPGRKRSQSQ